MDFRAVSVWYITMTEISLPIGGFDTLLRSYSTTELSCNQMIRQVVGAIQVTDDDMFAVDIDAAEGTVVEQEPGFQSA